jgi:transcriptional regulator with XRE-family HTH domain
MTHIGELVKTFRQAPGRGWTAKEMANRVGTSRQNIENLEAGRVRVPGYLVELADVMQVSTDELLGRKSSATRLCAREPAPAYRAPDLRTALDAVAAAIRQAPPVHQEAIATTLASWARERGAPHYAQLLLILLGPPLPPA